MITKRAHNKKGQIYFSFLDNKSTLEKKLQFTLGNQEASPSNSFEPQTSRRRQAAMAVSLAVDSRVPQVMACAIALSSQFPVMNGSARPRTKIKYRARR